QVGRCFIRDSTISNKLQAISALDTATVKAYNCTGNGNSIAFKANGAVIFAEKNSLESDIEIKESGGGRVFKDDGWHDVAFQSGYSYSGGQILQYTKKDGVVYLTGLFMREEPMKSNDIIIKLPAGYRPTKEKSTIVGTFGAGVSILTHISTNGDVKVSAHVPNGIGNNERYVIDTAFPASTNSIKSDVFNK